MRFFVLPIFGGVIMDTWASTPVSTTIKILDAHPLWQHRRFLVRNVLSLHFISGIYLSNILLHHFIGFIWIITPLTKKKCFSPRNQIHGVAFVTRVNSVCVQMRYAVFTCVKYATTPRNCWTRYPPRYSNGWAEFWSKPMKLLDDKLNHATD